MKNFTLRGGKVFGWKREVGAENFKARKRSALRPSPCLGTYNYFRKRKLAHSEFDMYFYPLP